VLIHSHLSNFVSACSFARRLKPLKGPHALRVRLQRHGQKNHKDSLSIRSSKCGTIHLGLVACHRFRVRGFHQRIADIAQVPCHRGARFARVAGGDSLGNGLMIPEPDGPVILHAHMGMDFLQMRESL